MKVDGLTDFDAGGVRRDPDRKSRALAGAFPRLSAPGNRGAAARADDERPGTCLGVANLPRIGTDHRSQARERPRCRRRDRLGERAPALLKLTSGTTAAPRAIRFRSAQLLADAEQICDTMGITEADLNFAVIPLSHSYGFSNLITPLAGSRRADGDQHRPNAARGAR